MPSNSISLTNDDSLLGTFLINAYLKSTIQNSNYYLTDVSKLKQYELDLYLLNQSQKKYNWNLIVTSPPKPLYEFDYGLTLKGTINETLKKDDNLKVQMNSITNGINEYTTINKDNEFVFENLVLADSATVNFRLVKNINSELPLKFYPQILNSKRKFNKPFRPFQFNCLRSITKLAYKVPDFNNVITLESVEIAQKEKTKLTHKNKLGNMNLRAYKVGEAETNSNLDVLEFIGKHGFDVQKNPTVSIVTRGGPVNLRGGFATPVVFIDDRQVMTFDELYSMRMNELDEIYIDPQAVVASSRQNRGVIKIYRKFETIAKKSNSKTFVINDGFAKNEEYKNSNYTNTEDKGFQDFGVIHWMPNIQSYDSLTFNVPMPKHKQNKAKIVIEGFSADGKLISDTRTVDLR